MKISQQQWMNLLMEQGVDVRSRIVYLSGEFGSDPSAGQTDSGRLIKSFILLDGLSHKPIRFWINTSGGDVHDMFAIHDTIRGLNSPVITIGSGSVQSAGGLLLAAGARRYVTENCYLMIHATQHQLHSQDISQAEMSNIIDTAKRVDCAWSSLMGSYTKMTGSWWMDQCDSHNETWCNASQIINLGVADEILPLRDILSVSARYKAPS